MSAPWSKEDAEKWAKERRVYGKLLSPHEQEIWLDALAKAAEIIEASPTVYWNDVNDGAYAWEEDYRDCSSMHIAKILCVKSLEEGET